MDLLAWTPFLISGLTLVLVVVTGRVWPILLPLGFWPLYFLGLQEGWWDPGFNTEGWVLGFIWEMLMAAVAVALGLVLHRLLARRSSSS